MDLGSTLERLFQGLVEGTNVCTISVNPSQFSSTAVIDFSYLEGVWDNTLRWGTQVLGFLFSISMCQDEYCDCCDMSRGAARSYPQRGVCGRSHERYAICFVYYFVLLF